MKNKINWQWIVVTILVLTLGLAACGTPANTPDAAAGTEVPSEIDADELMEDPDAGVVVTRVNADSPADKVGLQRGDIILMVGDREVNDVDDMREAMEAYEEGDKVQLAVRRGDELVMKTVELGAGPGRAYLGTSVCCGGTLLAVREDGIFEGSAQALVLDVTPDSPAEKAGLEMGDYIVSVDGEEIEYDTDLGDVIQAYQPGDTLTLEISREDEVQEMTVKLGENPDSEGTAYLGIQYQMLPGMSFISRSDLPEFRLGFVPEGGKRVWGFFPHALVFSVDEDSGHHFTFNGNINGLFIASVEEDSPAGDAGLQVHDVITRLDGEDIEDMDAFLQTLRAHSPGDKVILTIARSGEDEEMEITVTLSENPDDEGIGYLGVSLGGMIVTEVVGKEGEGSDTYGSFRFYFDEFPPLGFPFGDDV
jgi:S1-C subfamily serine protease